MQPERHIIATMDDKRDPIKSVAMLAHRELKSAANLTKEIDQFLATQGVKVRAGRLGDETYEKSLIEGPNDLILALGGDGTMLRAGELGAEGGTPVLGVNLGRLGFLMEVQRGDWRSALEKVMAGDYWLERRARVQVTLIRGGEGLGSWEALNECVVGRGRTARPVRIKAKVDQYYLATYFADAVICATATGSTAYALASGGPILPPELRNMLLVPVAPHLSADQAIVIPEGSTISLDVGEGPPVELSCDGLLHRELMPGDRVQIEASPEDAMFVRLEDPGYFFRNLTKYVNHDPPTAS